IPDVYLSDSMVSYKMMIDKEQTAKLCVLRDKHVPWVEHCAHNADSDAKVMMMLMKQVFIDPRKVYTKFSISCKQYMKLVGLSIYQKTINMEERIRNTRSH
ncbi:hypothetical protein QBC39DRAFT_264830, partial [Podospora conica]